MMILNKKNFTKKFILYTKMIFLFSKFNFIRILLFDVFAERKVSSVGISHNSITYNTTKVL